jgi:hypothetical protein
MKKREVVLGQVYAVKVSGRIQPVQVIAESPYGGWVGRNEQTGREVRIRSAAKLRSRLEKIDGKWRPETEPRPAPQADQQFQQGLTDQGVPY